MERGHVEKEVLLHGVRPELTRNGTDQQIALIIAAVDAYEEVAALLQQAFDGIVWALKRRGGRARAEDLTGDAQLRQHLERTRDELGRTLPRLREAVNRLRGSSHIDAPQLIEPLLRLLEDTEDASLDEQLAEMVLGRHERVQRDKAKAPWIERESSWTLMPGENRVDAAALPLWQGIYPHPFKVSNAYAFLGDLGHATVRQSDVEE
jgi:hypothetical protein